jgi:hypothetical protein
MTFADGLAMCANLRGEAALREALTLGPGCIAQPSNARRAAFLFPPWYGKPLSASLKWL